MSASEKILIFATPRGAAEHAAATLRDICAAKPAGSRVSVALSGGSTPALLYECLASSFRDEIPWSRLDVFFSDERAVAPAHPESNYFLAWKTLLSRVPLEAGQIHRMPADDKDLERAAQAYEDGIRGAVPAGASGVPAFDLIWLGVGEDGHTASLFPGTRALEEEERLIVPSVSPAGIPGRLTFTLRLLGAARRLQFLVWGRKKAAVILRLLGGAQGAAAEGAPSHGAGERAQPTPASLVRLSGGELEWLLDREAAAGIQDPGLIAGAGDDRGRGRSGD